MGSMNSNNWLSFPLSPTHHHASLPSQHLHSSQSHHFSLGLLNDNMDNIPPFQNQGLDTHTHTHIYISSSSYNITSLVSFSQLYIYTYIDHFVMNYCRVESDQHSRQQ